jgi:hypothetical protein
MVTSPKKAKAGQFCLRSTKKLHQWKLQLKKKKVHYFLPPGGTIVHQLLYFENSGLRPVLYIIYKRKSGKTRWQVLHGQVVQLQLLYKKNLQK